MQSSRQRNLAVAVLRDPVKTPWRRGSGRSRRAFKEGVDDGETAELAAVLHVLGEQRIASGFLCSGDDQRIVESNVVVSGKRDGGLVG